MRPGKVGAQCAHAAVGLYKVTVAQKAPWLSAWEVGKTLVYVLKSLQHYPTLCVPCHGFDFIEMAMSKLGAEKSCTTANFLNSIG